jgi:ABC-2 type transporter
MSELMILLHRNLRNMLRTPELFYARVGLCVVMGLVMGSVFYNSEWWSASSATSTVSFFAFFVCAGKVSVVVFADFAGAEQRRALDALLLCDAVTSTGCNACTSCDTARRLLMRHCHLLCTPHAAVALQPLALATTSMPATYLQFR